MIGQVLERARKTAPSVRERRYMCRRRSSATRELCGCGKVYRNAAALETFVAQQVIAVYEDPQILARMERGNDNVEQIAELQKRIEVTAGNLDAEADKRTQILSGGGDEYDLRVVDRTIEGLKVALKALEAEQLSLRSAAALAVLADLGEAGDMRRSWGSKGSRWRHEAAARVIEKVIVKPSWNRAAKWVDQNGRAYKFDPSSVEIVWREL